jgi:RNA polymerase primary sigma factor
MNLAVDEHGADADAEAPSSPHIEDRAVHHAFSLESLYFRSISGTPLLTQEEELALAKHVDEGTRRIKLSLKHAMAILTAQAQGESVRSTVQELRTIRGLSGLSAVALDRAEALLRPYAEPDDQNTGLPLEMHQHLLAALVEIQEARRQLEQGKEELVRRNFRLVVSIAKRYISRELTLLDLIQEGMIGLMKAAERFQYRKGVKFGTYATWWIRQGITRALAEQSRVIRIPVHQSEASSRIARAGKQLEQQFGRPPRIEEIAQALRLRPERVRDTLEALQEPMRLQTPVGDGGADFGDLLPDLQIPSPDTYTHRLERQKQLDHLLQPLTPREAMVIRMRYGIGYDKAMTLDEVGARLDLSGERIRQLEAHALKKLNTPDARAILASMQ